MESRICSLLLGDYTYIPRTSGRSRTSRSASAAQVRQAQTLPTQTQKEGLGARLPMLHRAWYQHFLGSRLPECLSCFGCSRCLAQLAGACTTTATPRLRSEAAISLASACVVPVLRHPCCERSPKASYLDIAPREVMFGGSQMQSFPRPRRQTARRYARTSRTCNRSMSGKSYYSHARSSP